MGQAPRRWEQADSLYGRDQGVADQRTGRTVAGKPAARRRPTAGRFSTDELASSLTPGAAARQKTIRQYFDHQYDEALTKEINTLLQDRGRASSIKTLLGDGFADALLGDLLDVKARLDSDESWAVIVDAYGVTAGIRSMEAFCDNRIDAALGTSHYDDRTVERAAIILSDVSRSIYTKVFGPPLPHTMQYTIPMNFACVAGIVVFELKPRITG